MPPKRKRLFSTDSKRKRARRAQETEEERKLRLEALRVRNAAARAQETEEKRQARLAALRHSAAARARKRKRAQRAQEIEEERQLRLEALRVHNAATRDQERLVANHVHHATPWAHETQERHQPRLEANYVHHATPRVHKTHYVAYKQYAIGAYDSKESDNVVYVKDEFSIKEEPLDERDMEVSEDEDIEDPGHKIANVGSTYGSAVSHPLTSTGPSIPTVSTPHTVSSKQAGTKQIKFLVLQNLVVHPNPVEAGQPSAVKKSELDEHVARMVFATNSPFSLVDHPYFRKMVTNMQPDYTSPTRKDIEDVYLPIVYEKERKKCADKLKGETVCLSLDGWSTIHIEPFICVTLMTANGLVCLVDVINMSKRLHNAQYFKELVKATVCKAEEVYGCHVCSLVTDNASNAIKIRKQIEKSGDPQLNLVMYVCSAYVLNLLAKDLELVSVKERVINVLNYFRKCPAAYTQYLQEGGQELIMPGDTREPFVPGDKRWNTISDCLKVFIGNLPLLMRICGDGQESDRTVRNGLQWAAEELLSRLEPVAVALDKTQSGRCTIAEAVDIWKELLTKFADNQKVTFKVKFRYSQVITKAHLLANMVHPSLQGRALTEEEKDTAIEFANEKCPGLITILTKFQARSPPFEDFKFSDQVTSSISATEWWQPYSNFFDKKSMSLVKQLLSALASTAGGDRVLSSYRLMRSRLSNSFGLRKAAQSVFLYQTFNQH